MEKLSGLPGKIFLNVKRTHPAEHEFHHQGEKIMPHSSGGGSHSGGSHGGSHNGVGASRKCKSKPFKGATRWVYYRDNEPVFFYTDFDVHKTEPLKDKIIFGGILLFIWCIIFVGLLHTPMKLRQNYDTTSYIIDNAGVITERKQLEGAMKRFLNTTGISPSVITVPKSYWKNDYENLEKYAYDSYIQLFGKNEKHWLIVYSTDFNNDFEDWAWEGMQGDRTDGILSDHETDLFNDTLHKALLKRNDYTVAEAFAIAFDTLTPVVMTVYMAPENLIALLFISFFFIKWSIDAFDIHPINKKKYKAAVECPDKFTDQEKCTHCGGIYIVGLHKNCPHCGANIEIK